jgi:hypothetical protein
VPDTQTEVTKTWLTSLSFLPTPPDVLLVREGPDGMPIANDVLHDVVPQNWSIVADPQGKQPIETLVLLCAGIDVANT